MIDKFTSICSVDTDIPQSGGVFSKIVGAKKSIRTPKVCMDLYF